MSQAWSAFVNKGNCGISGYRYDEEAQTLDVKFKGSTVAYRYKNVPEIAVRFFKQSTAPTTHLNKHIKPKYEFEILSGSEAA